MADEGGWSVTCGGVTRLRNSRTDSTVQAFNEVQLATGEVGKGWDLKVLTSNER